MEHPVPHGLIIFDLDGTLRQCKRHQGPCHADEGEWELCPGVQKTFAHYVGQPTRFAVATNQEGIGLRHRSRDMVMHQITLLASQLHITWAYVQICPHRLDERCLCRKPLPGMLLDICAAPDAPSREADDGMLFVGDTFQDFDAAKSAGVSFMWASRFFAS